jgi:hypothetical protein
LGKRCQVIAEFLTADLMEEFNFKKYSRCDWRWYILNEQPPPWLNNR